MDTISSSDERREDVTVSPEIAQQVRLILADLLAKAPPGLEGLPLELWLERILKLAVAADLLCLTPETVIKKYRSLLIDLDGRHWGMRLKDALRLANQGGGRRKSTHKSTK